MHTRSRFSTENGNKKKPPVEQKEEEVGELLRAKQPQAAEGAYLPKETLSIKTPNMQVVFSEISKKKRGFYGFLKNSFGCSGVFYLFFRIG